MTLLKHPYIDVRRGVFTMLIGVLLALIAPGVVSAQEAQDPPTEYAFAFAQYLSVTLTLPAGAPAEDVKLFLRPGDGATELHMITPEDGTAQYHRDVRAHPLPPFSRITYWWEYQDASGSEQTTVTNSFLYEDNRFAWETLASPEVPLSLHWVSGTPEMMTAGLDIARTALEEITTQLRRVEMADTRIYIYPSQSDLKQALRLSGRAWIGGEAHPEVGVALVAIPPTDQAISKMRTLLPHEITHLVLYRQLGAAGYTNVPTWLNEGLASHFEQRPDPNYALALDEAEAANRWIELGSLCRPFYDLPLEQLTLAYAQSQSVTEHIVEVHGWSDMRALLDAYADGLGCSAGLEQTLGVDLVGLEREWKVWLQQDEESASAETRRWAMFLVTLQEVAPWLLLVMLLLIPGLLMVLLPRPLQRSPET